MWIAQSDVSSEAATPQGDEVVLDRIREPTPDKSPFPQVAKRARASSGSSESEDLQELESEDDLEEDLEEYIRKSLQWKWKSLELLGAAVTQKPMFEIQGVSSGYRSIQTDTDTDTDADTGQVRHALPSWPTGAQIRQCFTMLPDERPPRRRGAVSGGGHVQAGVCCAVFRLSYQLELQLVRALPGFLRAVSVAQCAPVEFCDL